jgi:hypothetical protein
MGTNQSNIKKKESNVQEKEIRRKSQQKKKDSESSSKDTSRQSNSTSTSQKSLAFRFKPKLHRNRSTRSSWDRINHHYNSDSSTVHSNSFKSKFFIKKRKNKPAIAILDDEEGSGSLSRSSSPSGVSSIDLISNRSDHLEYNEPMIAAVAKLSAQFDKEQVAILSRHSFSPCMVTQHLEYRLNQCPVSKTNSNNGDCGYYSHTNSIQSNSSCQWPNEITNNLRPLPKQDSVCQRLNKEWLNTSLPSPSSQKCTSISSQDVLLDLFLRPNNEVDRRKEKDRQQRLVSITFAMFLVDNEKNNVKF